MQACQLTAGLHRSCDVVLPLLSLQGQLGSQQGYLVDRKTRTAIEASEAILTLVLCALVALLPNESHNQGLGLGKGPHGLQSQ